MVELSLPASVSPRGRTGEAQVTLSPGQRAEVEVPLTGGAASISGRVVWSHSGAPAQGTGVYLDRHRTEAERRTQGTPGTPVQLTVRREGGAEQTLLLTRAD